MEPELALASKKTAVERTEEAWQFHQECLHMTRAYLDQINTMKDEVRLPAQEWMLHPTIRCFFVLLFSTYWSPAFNQSTQSHPNSGPPLFILEYL